VAGQRVNCCLFTLLLFFACAKNTFCQFCMNITLHTTSVADPGSRIKNCLIPDPRSGAEGHLIPGPGSYN
jgi:hypothetical protein